MAATKARGGFGTRLQRGDGATPEVFTSIEECLDFSGPSRTLLTEDATHMESPNGWEEHVAIGVKGLGEITFDMHFVPGDSMQAALEADLAAGTLRNFRMILPGHSRRIAFSAYVQSISPSYPVKGKAVQSVTLRTSGQPTLEANP